MFARIDCVALLGSELTFMRNPYWPDASDAMVIQENVIGGFHFGEPPPASPHAAPDGMAGSYMERPATVFRTAARS
jgi:hypothetical protein